MSSVEFHRGTLKKVECDSVVDFCKSELSKYGKEDFSEYGPESNFDVIDALYDLGKFNHKEYVYVNNKIYEWLKHSLDYDSDEYFCETSPNADGTINVICQFHNGGTCLEEMLENMEIFK